MRKLSKMCVLGVVAALIGACDSSKPVATENQRFRGILAQMSKLEGGSLFFTLMLNGTSTDTRYEVTGQETRIVLPSGDLRSGVNSIRIEFYFKAGGADEILIADSVQSINRNQSDVMTLAGLDYRYADSDSDSIINAHELMQVDEDPDQDSLPNYLDADSDDDGVTDGVDFTPYGDATNIDDNAIIRFSYRASDGEMSLIAVGSIASDTGVLSALADDQTVSEFVPTAWPMNNVPVADSNTLWTAIEISAGGNATCPDWRISRDTSSLSSSLTQPAYGVFQRQDNTVILVPVGGGDIADMSLYRSDNTADGADTIDNSLIAVLVAPNTAGWLSLYSQRNFTGEPCILNSTFPRIN